MFTIYDWTFKDWDLSGLPPEFCLKIMKIMSAMLIITPILYYLFTRKVTPVLCKRLEKRIEKGGEYQQVYEWFYEKLYELI